MGKGFVQPSEVKETAVFNVEVLDDGRMVVDPTFVSKVTGVGNGIRFAMSDCVGGLHPGSTFAVPSDKPTVLEVSQGDVLRVEAFVDATGDANLGDLRVDVDVCAAVEARVEGVLEEGV